MFKLRNKLRRMGTVRITYIVITAVFLLLTLLVSIGFYNYSLQCEINERRVQLISVALQLQTELEDVYEDSVRQADIPYKSNKQNVLALNAVLQPLVDEILKVYPSYGLGYHDMRFDSIVAIENRFSTLNASTNTKE